MNLPSPLQLKKEIPLSSTAQSFVAQSRKSILDIFEGRDPRLLFIVGPCSIHNVEEGLLFAQKLNYFAKKMADTSFIVMRSYIEKPRTGSGWQGLLHDPHLDGTYDLIGGLRASRRLLTTLAEMGTPTATEFLTPSISPYIQDTISWGCIGARTSSSQVHRVFASSLSMAVGFKNTINGNIACAIQGVSVASSSHSFFHINEEGKLNKVDSLGNPHAHVVLRGSLEGPNYDEETVQNTLSMLKKEGLEANILIDCSHGNCGGFYTEQKRAFESILKQIEKGNRSIRGMMLECNLSEGNQPLPPKKEGVSITDACIDFSTMEELLSSSSRSISLTHN